MAAIYKMNKNLNTHGAEVVNKFCEFLGDVVNPVVFDRSVIDVAVALGVVTITIDSAIPEDDERYDAEHYEHTRIL